jgi:hypothetical protein
MIRIELKPLADGSYGIPDIYAGKGAFLKNPVKFIPDLIELKMHGLKSGIAVIVFKGIFCGGGDG